MPAAIIRLLAAAFAALAAGCASMQAAPLRAVATTAMVADLAREVGGERASVDCLMGPGVDPHSYKPTSADAAKLAKARLIFYNGLMLEGRMSELLERVSGKSPKAVALGAALPDTLLLKPELFGGHYDPHIWFDVSLWARAVPVVVAAYAEADPEGAAYFSERGAALEKRLAALHAWCLETTATIPANRRVLVTSHDAFGYFGRAYGFRVVALQGVSTVSEAALADVVGLADFIRQHKVPAIFVETSVNPVALRRVAEDAGVKIGGELFSDAMGAPGEWRLGFDTGTYEGMVRYNVTAIAEALR